MKFLNSISSHLKTLILSILFGLMSTSVDAQNLTTNQNHLPSTIGALQKLISEKTKVSGVNEKQMKLDPQAAKTYQVLQDDLELCQTIKTNNPEIIEINKDGVSVKFKTFHLKISGDKCPLEIEAALNSKEHDLEYLKAEFILKLAFKNQKYIDKYKLRHISANGIILAKAIKVDTTVKINTNIEVSSKGNSLELKDFEQNLALNLDISFNLANFQFGMLMIQNNMMKSDQQIDKGYSKVEMQGLGQVSQYYSINDKEVSETEFQKFLQSFVLPAIVSDEEPNAPDGRVQSNCSYALFEKNKITLDNFKNLFQQKKLPTDGLVAQGNSCMQDKAISVNYQNKSHSVNLQFAQDWIVINSDIQSNNENAAVYVLYGDQEVQTKETNEFWMGLQCQPVNTCN